MGILCSSNFVNNQCLMLGLDGSGKTTLLYRYVLKQFDKFIPETTIGFNYEQVVERDEILGIWDLGGKETIRTLWPQFYKNIKFNAIIYVIDVNDSRQLLTKLVNEEELRDCVLSIVYNRKHSDKNELTKLELEELQVTLDSQVGYEFLPQDLVKKSFLLDVSNNESSNKNILKSIKAWIVDKLEVE